MLIRSISSHSAAATDQVSATRVILLVQPRPLERRDRLRVADPGDVALGVEHHRGGDDRAGQTAASDLVHAGDGVEADAADGVLDRPEGPDLDHG